MGSPGGYAPRLQLSPPEKGSFPLDHFGECLTFTKAYQQCLAESGNLNSACHKIAKAYLQCRMDRGLMAKEDLDSLGFKKDLVPVTDAEREAALAKTRGHVAANDKGEYFPGVARMRAQQSQ